MKPFQLNRKIAVAVLAVAGMGAQAAALSEAEARRFLQHATFGPTVGNVIDLTAAGKQAWLQQQFAQSGSDYRNLSYVDPNRNIGCPNDTTGACRRANYSLFPVQVQFFNNAINQPDQLRQRTALALSEILVVSGTTIKLPYAMANYQRIFLNNAFGNFRTILRDVTLSPAMGRYLNMANNDKPNSAKGIEPNENYAREVLQLFSIGLWQLNPDGTQVIGANGQPVPSYDQETVEGFAHVFTGWTYPPRPTATNNKFPNKESYQSPMIAFEDHHDTGPKILLNGVVLPAGQSAVADMEAAVSNIFNHPNVGPFIGRQLIQQLVTANPSPAYVARVTAAFNGASGTPRGDMKTVLTAILLDPEATTPLAPEKFGKLREPILQLTHLFRTLGGASDGVWLRSQSSSLGQPVFSPPTVFSFFSPEMDLPDDPTLDGPAFGLFNASNAFKLSGILSTALSGIGVAPDSRWVGATGSKIDLTRLQALAADPVALMREINKLMFAGGASSALQQSLIRAAQIAPATKPLDRAKAALFLAAMSPEYLVEN